MATYNCWCVLIELDATRIATDTCHYESQDECQKISNPDTKIAQAVCAVKKDHGLLLSGTPAQVSVCLSYRDMSAVRSNGT